MALPGNPSTVRKVVCFATQGSGSQDERRVKDLLAPLGPTCLRFDRSRKLLMPGRLLLELRRHSPRVVVMEGTGLAGGLALLLARWMFGIPYVVSTGDAVAPYLAADRPWLRPIASVYERLLYTHSAGVIGWSPYVVGRAISMGARRAATAANWSTGTPDPEARRNLRKKLGIPDEAVVFGLVGSLNLNRRLDWCYGSELVRALRATRRDDLRVLIVGDGTGLDRLKDLAGDDLGRRLILPGRCSPEDVMDHLAVMDVGSLPQTLDAVGAIRYTTKLSEYVAAGLPIVTGQLPLAYDLDDGWMWRLPGETPWSPEYVAGLSSLMEGVTANDLAARRERVPVGHALFDRELQVARVTALIDDVIAANA